MSVREHGWQPTWIGRSPRYYSLSHYGKYHCVCCQVLSCWLGGTEGNLTAQNQQCLSEGSPD
jgi:NADH:ubiquinone oxidoreductase subunit E